MRDQKPGEGLTAAVELLFGGTVWPGGDDTGAGELLGAEDGEGDGKRLGTGAPDEDNGDGEALDGGFAVPEPDADADVDADGLGDDDKASELDGVESADGVADDEGADVCEAVGVAVAGAVGEGLAGTQPPLQSTHFVPQLVVVRGALPSAHLGRFSEPLKTQPPMAYLPPEPK